MVEGFDVVIGNPPYIQLQKNGGELRRRYENASYETFSSTGDIYQLFYEKGCLLLQPNRGLLAYITSNSWLKAEYGKKLRRYFAERHTPLVLLEMGKDVFESAIVDTNILILHHKKANVLGRAVDMDRLPNKIFPPENNSWGELRPQEDRPWMSLSAIEQRIMDKMKDIGTPLKEWDISIYRGILTGYNDAFIIDNETKEALLRADPKSAEIIKPVLRGRDIKRYQAQWAGLWLIDSHNGYKDVPPVNIEDYPAVKQYLNQYYPQLKKRQDKGVTPYNLRNCSYHSEFIEEKLFWIDLTEQGRFAYDLGEMFCLNSAYMLTGNSLRYLCVVLNSALVTWFMQNSALNSGMGTTRWVRFTVDRIPIPIIDAITEQPFIQLVNKILHAHDVGADTTDLEAEIDQLVFGLYELTEDEAQVITGKLRVEAFITPI